MSVHLRIHFNFSQHLFQLFLFRRNVHHPKRSTAFDNLTAKTTTFNCLPDTHKGVGVVVLRLFVDVDFSLPHAQHLTPLSVSFFSLERPALYKLCLFVCMYISQNS